MDSLMNSQFVESPAPTALILRSLISPSLILLGGDIHPNPGPRHQNPTNSLNILQININGLNNKIPEINHFLYKHNIHIALIQEAYLPLNSHPPKFYNYDTIFASSLPPHHSLMTLIRNDLTYHNTSLHTSTLLNNPTIRLQSLSVKSLNSTFNIVNIYLPHPSSTHCPPNFHPDLSPLLTLDNLFIGGDFNALHPLWSPHPPQPTPRGSFILQSLEPLSILNSPLTPTRKPTQHNQTPTSPDISLISPHLFPIATWTVHTDLNSDHLPIVINLHNSIPLPPPLPSFTNYKKANWPLFTSYIESNCHNIGITNHKSLVYAISTLTQLIQDASHKFIPSGKHKRYKPYLSPHISALISQRNTLRTSPHLTRATSNQINTLNTNISNEINNKKKQHFENYIKHNISSLSLKKTWKTIKTLQNSHLPPPSHQALPSNLSPPSLKKQSNTFAKFYHSLSFKPTDPRNRIISHRLQTTPLETPFPPHHTHPPPH